MSLPIEPIRSSSNPLLKRVRAAGADRGGEELLLEGDRLVDDALRAGWELTAVLVAEERPERLAELREAGLPVRAVRGSLLSAAGTLGGAPGCLALAGKPRPRALADLPQAEQALVVVAAGIQDPGNLGALARTAEAAGAVGLLVTTGGCRPWNSKALRGSMGSLLRLPVVEMEPSRAGLDELSRAGFRHVTARTRGGRPFHEFDWSGRILLWLTAETGELPGGLEHAGAFEGVSIPMRAPVESLNVNAAAAVLLFAAGRSGGGVSADLFGHDEESEPESVAADAPLAERMRPRTLEEYVGQTHLVGAGRVLEKALRGELSTSLILWGPPGTGKTTLARLLAGASRRRFVPFSAVMSGIKEIREVMTAAAANRRRSGKSTLLFVDEIHRFNKAQQDAFLPHVERGDILLIGATTENPSFEVVGPLLSRARTLVLRPLEEAELVAILARARDDAERGLGGASIDEEGLRWIAQACDGDARRALTLLEVVADLADGRPIDKDLLQEALQKKTLFYDKGGEEHFSLISALHKSVRNSDQDAALYWLVRMLEAGEDRRYLARRLIRIAVEDIGLADTNALRVCLDAAQAYERLGTPEGELALAQAAVYMARAPKSNAVYVAYGAARDDVAQTRNEAVPLHMRNAVTALMKGQGYGKGYRYAHDDPGAKEEMACLPPGLVGRRYFDAEGGDSVKD